MQNDGMGRFYGSRKNLALSQMSISCHRYDGGHWRETEALERSGRDPYCFFSTVNCLFPICSNLPFLIS